MKKDSIKETTKRLKGLGANESALVYGVVKGMEMQKNIKAASEDKKTQAINKASGQPDKEAS